MSWEYPTQGNAPVSKVEIEKLLTDDNNLAKRIITAKPSLLPTEREMVKAENTSKSQPSFETVWAPIPGTSQELAITSPAHITLYCGARGPGKTITQLMYFRRFVGVGYGSYWRGVIFDREFKHLSDLVAQSNRFFPKFEDGAVWHKSASDYKWVWPTGEELLFRHVKTLEDYNSFHGHEYAFIGWNELTKHPNLDLFDKFMSVNRSSFQPELHTPKKEIKGQTVYDTPDGKPLPPIPLKVFATTNPSGPGHGAVKRRFIDPAPYGKIVRTDISYYDPVADKDIKVTRTQVTLFGSFYENPYLDTTYKAGLIAACQKEPHLKAAWIDGSWDVTAGGAIDDLWDSGVHVIERFRVPENWKVDRSFDWGSSHPFACVWWAEANGEEIVDELGKKWCPARGSLIAICDYYGADDYTTNRGLKLSVPAICDGIKEHEKILKACSWVTKEIQAGPADNQIRNVIESDVDTIEIKMRKEGIRWSESDKSPGSRVIGLQLFRDRLKAAVIKEGPAVYFTRNCQACIQTLPTLPRDPDKIDDVDTEAIDHVWDAVRYRILKGNNRISTKIKTVFPK